MCIMWINEWEYEGERCAHVSRWHFINENSDENLTQTQEHEPDDVQLEQTTPESEIYKRTSIQNKRVIARLVLETVLCLDGWSLWTTYGRGIRVYSSPPLEVPVPCQRTQSATPQRKPPPCQNTCVHLRTKIANNRPETRQEAGHWSWASFLVMEQGETGHGRRYFGTNWRSCCWWFIEE